MYVKFLALQRGHNVQLLSLFLIFGVLQVLEDGRCRLGLPPPPPAAVVGRSPSPESGQISYKVEWRHCARAASVWRPRRRTPKVSAQAQCKRPKTPRARGWGGASSECACAQRALARGAAVSGAPRRCFDNL